MICHNEEIDIDSIVGQFCSQQDFLQAEIDIISLRFTEEDLGICNKHHENDKSDTLPQLPKNVQNNIVNYSNSYSYNIGKEFQNGKYQK